jgi:hypothetical protein
MLAVKERIRQHMRAELAEANAGVETAERHASERENVRTHAAHAVGRRGEVEGSELQHRAELFALARRDCAEAAKVLVERNTERDVRKEAVVDATRDTRMIETLRQRSLVVESKAQSTREQTELDEISGHTQTRRGT